MPEDGGCISQMVGASGHFLLFLFRAWRSARVSAPCRAGVLTNRPIVARSLRWCQRPMCTLCTDAMMIFVCSSITVPVHLLIVRPCQNILWRAFTEGVGRRILSHSDHSHIKNPRGLSPRGRQLQTKSRADYRIRTIFLVSDARSVFKR